MTATPTHASAVPGLARHRFDPLSFALGVLTVAVGVALLLADADVDVDADWVLPFAVVVVAIALLVSTIRSARPAPPPEAGPDEAMLAAARAEVDRVDLTAEGDDDGDWPTWTEDAPTDR